MYLAVQKADDFSNGMGSPLLVRREYGGQLTIEEFKNKEAKTYLKRLKQTRKLMRRYEGEELFDSLNSLVVMDRYFQWLAFNQLILNGDYTDELFLYVIPGDERFDIIPWDYDDVFRKEPHEGLQQRNRTLKHELLFSSEAYIDIVIDKDDYLYQRYLLNFREVLEKLSAEAIKGCFEQVYRELLPLFHDPGILEQSTYDQSGLTSVTLLRQDLQTEYQGLVKRRLQYLDILENR